MDPLISMVAVIRNFLKDDLENEMTTMQIEFTMLLLPIRSPSSFLITHLKISAVMQLHCALVVL